VTTELILERAVPAGPSAGALHRDAAAAPAHHGRTGFPPGRGFASNRRVSESRHGLKAHPAES
jgi:hypothetical protein